MDAFQKIVVTDELSPIFSYNINTFVRFRKAMFKNVSGSIVTKTAKRQANRECSFFNNPFHSSPRKTANNESVGLEKKWCEKPGCLDPEGSIFNTQGVFEKSPGTGDDEQLHYTEYGLQIKEFKKKMKGDEFQTAEQSIQRGILQGVYLPPIDASPPQMAPFTESRQMTVISALVANFAARKAAAYLVVADVFSTLPMALEEIRSKSIDEVTYDSLLAAMDYLLNHTSEKGTHK